MGIQKFTDLPLAVGLSGQEVVPVDSPNGNGTFTTKRTTILDIAGIVASQPPTLAAMTAFLQSLPTSPPSLAGVWWNNGGVLTLSG